MTTQTFTVTSNGTTVTMSVNGVTVDSAKPKAPPAPSAPAPSVNKMSDEWHANVDEALAAAYRRRKRRMSPTAAAQLSTPRARKLARQAAKRQRRKFYWRVLWAGLPRGGRRDTNTINVEEWRWQIDPKGHL